MTPIDRVSIKSKALAVLGLNNTTASDDDIRLAYRACIRQKHPDRCNGNSEGFLEATEAFNFLRGETDTFDPQPSQADDAAPRPTSRTPRPSMDFAPKPRKRSQTLSRPVSKPSVQETETTFSEDVLKSCTDLLGEEGGLLATRQKRAGRKLTYTVPVRLLGNMNKVAMPTGDLFDKRRIKPILLDVPATEISGGSYIVPESHLEKCFPGARRVEIRFVADI